MLLVVGTKTRSYCNTAAQDETLCYTTSDMTPKYTDNTSMKSLIIFNSRSVVDLDTSAPFRKSNKSREFIDVKRRTNRVHSTAGPTHPQASPYFLVRGWCCRSSEVTLLMAGYATQKVNRGILDRFR